ncbi:heparin lyase I family protein [Ruegeria lacuscaerulensis]|uniref:heparin lyase I family protein n=1 Tax=Ruegeria lacuscaerulensis TaxID=55218 RepID=UPI00147B818D|nr:heparin lyase I family protein [Ruegeria lacuscaerulensis]
MKNVFLVLSFVIAGASVNADSLKFRSFEQNRSNLPGSYDAVRSSQIPLSGRGHRFRIYGGDCVVPNYGGQSVGDCTYKSVRSQLMERGWNKPSIKQPESAWYGFDFLMPQDFPIGGAQTKGLYNYVQWKGNNCPHVALVSNQKSTQLAFQLMRTTGTNDCEPLVKKGLLNLNTVKGRWTRIEVFARWSKGNEGRLEFYVDGERVGTHSGPTLTAMPAQSGASIKNHFDFGPYLCCTSGLQNIRPGTLYYANVSRAATRDALWK